MGTVRIPLHNRKNPDLCAIIDEEDYDLVSGYQWRATSETKTCYTRYAIGRVPGTGPHGKTYQMHRIILGVPDGTLVDHKNRNGLDNRRENLRPATHSQNGANRGVHATSKSGYRGVMWHGATGKWIAVISHEGRDYRLGTFDDPADAARAYDARAYKLYGEFAGLNFPECSNPQPVRWPAKSVSGYRGVRRFYNRWLATYGAHGKTKYLGSYATAEDAARAYDAYARSMRGDQARLNFPDEVPTRGEGRGA